MTHHRPLDTRRGSIMVIVLGLITIMLSMVLALTVLVYNGTKASYDYQASVQYYLHMDPATGIPNDSTCPYCPH